MRIFYASDTSPNAFFQSNLWRNNLYLPLLDLGHEVIEFDYDLRQTFQNTNSLDPAQKAFTTTNRPKVSRELLRQVKAAHSVKPLDLFFSYFYDACVLPQTIEEIKALGIKTVNWYCDGAYLLHLVSEISPHYDWCLVPEKFRLDDYRAMHANPIYCQEAANPNIYQPYDLPVEYEVAFVGQAYGERPAYIRYLLDQGIAVRVWGRSWDSFATGKKVNPLARARFIAGKLTTRYGWQILFERLNGLKMGQTPGGVSSRRVSLPDDCIGGVLSDEEMVKLYSRTKINLGFSTVARTYETGQRLVQVRLRDFEVPMSGGFYMVEYMEELEEFFEIGKEIVCYKDAADLAVKIKYYLSHDAEREAIRQAGYQRCLRDHSWQKRFEQAFAAMGLAAAS